MPGDKTIETFRQRGDAWNILIQPQRPFSVTGVGKRTKDALRAAVNASVRLNKLDGGFKPFARQLGELFGHPRILRWDKFHPSLRGPLPASHPELAEVAVPIVD